MNLPRGLIGRTFDLRTANCWTLCRDYYAAAHGIELPDVASPTDWWLKGLRLYADLLPTLGFEVVHEPPVFWRPGDLALMAVKAPVGNHAGVIVEGGRLLHHLPGRLSVVEPIRSLHLGTLLNVYRHPAARPTPVIQATSQDLIDALPVVLRSKIARHLARPGPDA